MFNKEDITYKRMRTRSMKSCKSLHQQNTFNKHYVLKQVCFHRHPNLYVIQTLNSQGTSHLDIVLNNTSAHYF